jgi:hypothetical protein
MKTPYVGIPHTFINHQSSVILRSLSLINGAVSNIDLLVKPANYLLQLLLIHGEWVLFNYFTQTGFT